MKNYLSEGCYTVFFFLFFLQEITVKVSRIKNMGTIIKMQPN